MSAVEGGLSHGRNQPIATVTSLPPIPLERVITRAGVPGGPELQRLHRWKESVWTLGLKCRCNLCPAPRRSLLFFILSGCTSAEEIRDLFLSRGPKPFHRGCNKMYSDIPLKCRKPFPYTGLFIKNLLNKELFTNCCKSHFVKIVEVFHFVCKLQRWLRADNQERDLQ